MSSLFGPTRRPVCIVRRCVHCAGNGFDSDKNSVRAGFVITFSLIDRQSFEFTADLHDQVWALTNREAVGP